MEKQKPRSRSPGGRRPVNDHGRDQVSGTRPGGRAGEGTTWRAAERAAGRIHRGELVTGVLSGQAIEACDVSREEPKTSKAPEYGAFGAKRGT